MAIETGTAAGHNDLLDKLHTFLTTVCGWTSLSYVAGAAATDEAKMSVRGPGFGAGREVFVNIRTQANVAAGAYGWQLFGANGYDSSFDFIGQPGGGGGCWFNTWGNEITYWFYGNERRFIIAARVGTVYITMYAGFFLPYALPNEYPFPLYIAGNYRELNAADVSNTANRFIADPGISSGFYRTRAGQWKMMYNHQSGSSSRQHGGDADEGRAQIYPSRAAPQGNTDAGTPTRESWDTRGLLWLRPNINDETPMFVAQILDGYARKFSGALDGVFITPGFGRTSEQQLVFNGENYRVFQNIFRTTGFDYMVIKED